MVYNFQHVVQLSDKIQVNLFCLFVTRLGIDQSGHLIYLLIYLFIRIIMSPSSGGDI